MKLCLIGKYPPIQGGVSSQMYWLARGLAELGHEIHFVTNADEVEMSYRMYLPTAERQRLECRFSTGGSVSLHTTREPRYATHIPYANPFVSKLAALAADVVTSRGCELVYTSYFEPYGIAGALAARWTGVPFTVKHAGSDIGRLAEMPDRTRAYRELLRDADVVFTGAPLVRPLLQWGIDLNKLHVGLEPYWPEEFTPDGPSLDISALLTAVRESEFASPLTPRSYDSNLPSIGMYGKPGKVKGTIDLIDALSALQKRGREFNLVFLSGASGTTHTELCEYLRGHGLEHRTYMLPFIPHWLVPSFLRACTALCVLENRFPIAIHQPATALETLACGTCLLLSEEIRAKQWSGDELRDGQNVLLVRDPQDVTALEAAIEWVLDHPGEARAVGASGAQFFDRTFARGNLRVFDPLVERLAGVIERRRSQMSLHAFQQVLFTLYTNTAFRAAVRENQSLLDAYTLDSQERAAAAGLIAAKHELDRFANELQEKSFRYCWNHFATVKRFFAAVETEAFHLHCERHDFRDRGWMGNIEHFATTLIACSEPHRVVAPACFADAVRYDVALIRAATARTTNQPGFLESGCTSFPTPDSIIDRGPQRFTQSLGVEILRLNFDIPALYTGTPPEGLSPSQMVFGVVPSRDGAHGLAFALAPGMERMVDRARVGATLDDLVEAAAVAGVVSPERSGFRAACVRAVTTLVERGLLTPAPPDSEGPNQ